MRCSIKQSSGRIAQVYLESEMIDAWPQHTRQAEAADKVSGAEGLLLIMLLALEVVCCVAEAEDKPGSLWLQKERPPHSG